MLFLFYLSLFLAAIFIYYFVNNRYKVYVLFISSIGFITALSMTVALFSLLFSLLNYYFGIVLEKVNKKKSQDQLFWFFIIADIGILAFFKYFDSFFQGLTSLFSDQGIYTKVPYLTLMIPIGISYYTFQSLGYLIRIDRGNEKAERNFAAFATYLLFFPKFLSGPVERSNHFFPQLNKPIAFERRNIEDGARLILWGLFKKIVIADNLYESVSQLYGDIHHYTGMALITILIIQTV